MEINGIELSKPIEEMSEEEICELAEQWAEINDSFIGYRLDEKKKKAYEKLVSLCGELVSLGGHILFEPRGIHNRQRHAGVILHLPVIGAARDERVLRLLAELFSTADDAMISALGDRPLLSFYIMDMWEEHGELITNYYRT